MTDAVDVADAASERAHGFTSGGTVTRERAGDRVGGHDLRRLTRTIRGRNSWIAYRLAVASDRPVTLEIEEMESRERDVRGYQILVDGVPTCLRTARGSGGGPVHCFVRLPGTDGKKYVTLKLLNRLDAPVRIRRLWVWDDLDAHFDASGMAVPYHLAPTVPLTWSDVAADRAKLETIKTSLGAHPHVRAAWTTWIPYAARDRRETEANIDYALELAEASGLPVQIAFDTWWSSTPAGQDGRGGFWGDVEYQQVVYDAAKRAYRLSIPNQWSNTPWLTVNHPRLNAFKTRRLAESIAYLRRRSLALHATGKRNPILALNLDNEPVYWASGNAGLGDGPLLADFNKRTVEAAKRDGVVLDPTNGLEQRERLWLLRNLLAYNEMIAGTVARALDRDASIVTTTGATPASDLLRNNVYTQAMVADPDIQYPILDRDHPFWESAAPASARVGGEWNGDSLPEREAVERQIALGRNAAVNAEAGGDAGEMRGVRPGYALGQRYFALYNYPLDKMDGAAAELRDLARPFPEPIYEPVLREERFVEDGTWKRRVIARDGLASGYLGNTAAYAVFPAASSEPGHLTYRLDAPNGGLFETGLVVEWSGRAFVFRKKDPRVHIRVLVGEGPEPAGMREVGRVFDDGDINAVHRSDLGAAARGRRAVHIRFEMHAPGLPPGVLSWCALRLVRFTIPWPEALLRPNAFQVPTLGAARKQNLVVSWRRDAELAMEELARMIGAGDVHLRAARAAFRRGDYANAYRLACAGACVRLPATYAIREGGPLAPYPVRVDASRPLTCILEAWDREQVSLRLHAEEDARATVRLTNLQPGAAYTVERQGAHWRVRKGPSPAQTVRASGTGEIVFAAMVRADRTEAGRERTIRGIFRAGAGKEGFHLFPDDGGSVRIAVDARTAITRGQPGEDPSPAVLAELRFGDAVVARLNAQGVAEVIAATYQILERSIRAFEPMTPWTMPHVELTEEDRSTRRVIDLSATLHLPGGAVSFKAVPSETVELAVGDHVTLRINPDTGRVFEIWKKAAGM